MFSGHAYQEGALDDESPATEQQNFKKKMGGGTDSSHSLKNAIFQAFSYVTYIVIQYAKYLKFYLMNSYQYQWFKTLKSIRSLHSSAIWGESLDLAAL